MEKQPPDEPGIAAGLVAAVLILAIAAASFTATAWLASTIDDRDLKAWSRSQLEEIQKWLED